MYKTQMKWGVGLAAALALLVVLAFGLTTVAAGQNPTEIKVYASGEAVSAPYVTFDLLAGGTGNITADLRPKGQDTTGNRFTFAVNATKDKDGNIPGLMMWKDIDLGVVIEGNVDTLTVHPSRGAPTGFNGPSYRMAGKTTKEVTIGGITFPVRSTIRNSPTYDGVKSNHYADAVCFEIFRAPTDAEKAEDPEANEVKVFQWPAFVSGGSVQIAITR